MVENWLEMVKKQPFWQVVSNRLWICSSYLNALCKGHNVFAESVIVPIFAVVFSLAYWILAIICYNNLLDKSKNIKEIKINKIKSIVYCHPSLVNVLLRYPLCPPVLCHLTWAYLAGHVSTCSALIWRLGQCTVGVLSWKGVQKYRNVCLTHIPLSYSTAK